MKRRREAFASQAHTLLLTVVGVAYERMPEVLEKVQLSENLRLHLLLANVVNDLPLLGVHGALTFSGHQDHHVYMTEAALADGGVNLEV